MRTQIKRALLLAFALGFAGIAGAYNYKTGTVGGSTIYNFDSSGNLILAGSLSTTGVITSTSTGTNSLTGYLTVTSTLTASSAVVTPRIVIGAQGSTISTVTATGNFQGLYVPVYISPGTQAVFEGAVIIATTSVTNQLTGMVAPGVTDLTNVLGIATSSSTAGAVVNVCYNGFAVALTTGVAAAPGDVLVTSATAAGIGYLAVDNSPTSGAEVGIALSASPVLGGRTLIKVIR